MLSFFPIAGMPTSATFNVAYTSSTAESAPGSDTRNGVIAFSSITTQSSTLVQAQTSTAVFITTNTESTNFIDSLISTYLFRGDSIESVSTSEATYPIFDFNIGYILNIAIIEDSSVNYAGLVDCTDTNYITDSLLGYSDYYPKLEQNLVLSEEQDSNILFSTIYELISILQEQSSATIFILESSVEDSINLTDYTTNEVGFTSINSETYDISESNTGALETLAESVSISNILDSYTGNSVFVVDILDTLVSSSEEDGDVFVNLSTIEEAASLDNNTSSTISLTSLYEENLYASDVLISYASFVTDTNDLTLLEEYQLSSNYTAFDIGNPIIASEQIGYTSSYLGNIVNSISIVDMLDSLSFLVGNVEEITLLDTQEVGLANLVVSIEELLPLEEYTTTQLAILDSILANTALAETCNFKFIDSNTLVNITGPIVVTYDNKKYVTSEARYIALVSYLISIYSTTSSKDIFITSPESDFAPL